MFCGAVPRLIIYLFSVESAIVVFTAIRDNTHWWVFQGSFTFLADVRILVCLKKKNHHFLRLFGCLLYFRWQWNSFHVLCLVVFGNKGSLSSLSLEQPFVWDQYPLSYNHSVHPKNIEYATEWGKKIIIKKKHVLVPQRKKYSSPTKAKGVISLQNTVSNPVTPTVLLLATVPASEILPQWKVRKRLLSPLEQACQVKWPSISAP